MPSIRIVLKSSYYISKLVFSLVWALIYLKWSTWRAKRSFGRALRDQGLPRDVADELAGWYGKQNAQLLKSFLRLRSTRE